MADMLTVVSAVSAVIGLLTGSIDLAKKLKVAILKARAALKGAAHEIFSVPSHIHIMEKGGHVCVYSRNKEETKDIDAGRRFYHGRVYKPMHCFVPNFTI